MYPYIYIYIYIQKRRGSRSRVSSVQKFSKVTTLMKIL